MPHADIYRELTEVFRDVFDDDSIVLTPDTTSADIADWDSVAHVNLVVAIEQRMHVTFKTTEVEGLHNVGQLVEVLERKLGATSASGLLKR